MRLPLLIFFCFIGFLSSAQPFKTDYTLYHKGIIAAEQSIFIDGNSKNGLDVFKNTFSQFDFVFIDDCIEAFQLALFFKNEEYAMIFIKKAIENGFEIDLLDKLSLFTLENLNLNNGKYVVIHKGFIKKYRSVLDDYRKKYYPKFVRCINTNLFVQINKHHALEQLFKNFHIGLAPTPEIQMKAYLNICTNNLHFFDSLAREHIFLGERNLGCYTNQLADSLKMTDASIEICVKDDLLHFNLPSNTYVPIITENDYYRLSPVYNMLFHNQKSYQTLLKYRDEAVKTGYWHPREFASLKFNNNRATVDDSTNLYLERYYKKATVNTQKIDEERAKLLLPSYEIDHQKFLFGKQNNLKLFFGFFNGTK